MGVGSGARRRASGIAANPMATLVAFDVYWRTFGTRATAQSIDIIPRRGGAHGDSRYTRYRNY